MSEPLRTLWISLSPTGRTFPLRLLPGKDYEFVAAGVGKVTVRVDG